MSTSVDSHHGAGPSGSDGEPDATSTEHFPAPVREESPAPRPRRRSRGLRVPSASAAPAVPAVPDDEATGSGAEAPATTTGAPVGPPPTAATSKIDVGGAERGGDRTVRHAKVDHGSVAAPAAPAPAGPAAPTAAPAPAAAPATSPGPTPTPRPRPTPGPRPAAAPGAGAPPSGGPPPSTAAKEPPRKHTAALGRLALVLVLVAAVVGTVVVLQQRSQFGRTDAGAEEIPALEVAPAQVDLNTVGQPNAIAPPPALLPGTATAPQPGRAPTISAWANGLASRTNIPAVALQAYGMADLTMRQVDEGCHLSWVTIAGLARIESNHGRYRGAQVLPSGDVTPRIIGVPLDGTSGNRTITDTDGGALDGDPALDRAVGPLQFIPSTWARWRSDGNADGRADPNNIFDVALAAGRYLCAGGRDLASGEGWRSAVLSYNYSDEYGRRVYAAARAYAGSTTP